MAWDAAVPEVASVPASAPAPSEIQSWGDGQPCDGQPSGGAPAGEEPACGESSGAAGGTDQPAAEVTGWAALSSPR